MRRRRRRRRLQLNGVTISILRDFLVGYYMIDIGAMNYGARVPARCWCLSLSPLATSGNLCNHELVSLSLSLYSSDASCNTCNALCSRIKAQGCTCLLSMISCDLSAVALTMSSCSKPWIRLVRSSRVSPSSILIVCCRIVSPRSTCSITSWIIRPVVLFSSLPALKSSYARSIAPAPSYLPSR